LAGGLPEALLPDFTFDSGEHNFLSAIGEVAVVRSLRLAFLARPNVQPSTLLPFQYTENVL
jgi:hypothetical protein